jgi:hypothetical protein
MGLPARYQVIDQTNWDVTIMDLGPWTIHLTVTNDAERVVEELMPLLAGRKLYYIDSEGDMDELVIKDGKFAGFAPGPGRK